MIALWGANGFIGRHLTHKLIDCGEDTQLFARNYDDFPFALPDTLKSYSRDFSKPYTYINDISVCDTIILLVTASYARTFSHNPEQEIEYNIKPYYAFFDALKKCTDENKHIIFLSSGGAIYGETEHIPISETHDTKPINAYGQGKLRIEKSLIDAAQDAGWDYTILRVANPVGKWGKKPNLIGAALNAIQNDDVFNVYGDGSAIRDYFCVEELANAIYLSAKNSDARNKIYNVGSGKGHSANEVFEIIERISHKSLKIKNIDAIDTDVAYNVLNCTKIEHDLEWKAKMNLEDTIRKMWEST